MDSRLISPQLFDPNAGPSSETQFMTHDWITPDCQKHPFVTNACKESFDTHTALSLLATASSTFNTRLDNDSNSKKQYNIVPKKLHLSTNFVLTLWS
jgi:hypothetical protein